ncbi:hypothetical protein Q8A67_011072 [Cirrhinus molitorella]|uniref:Uncharacterized protein n=1 Tax=Cirrhinus molitorella TaxID=172907 RepID=A0AA88PR82_9TELE|nr:hypothetical protein Q8A67_011072 [Cirrhinus molitorella]
MEKWQKEREGVEYLRGIPQESPEYCDDDSRTVLVLAEGSSLQYGRLSLEAEETPQEVNSLLKTNETGRRQKESKKSAAGLNRQPHGHQQHC